MVWMSEFPAIVRAGTTIKWRDGQATVPFNQNATSTDGWALTYYLRTNTASEGHTSVGSSYNSGWEFTISSSDSTNFDKGDWSWTAIVSKGSESFQLAVGEFIVKESLVYSGTPGAIDTRTQNEIDRDNIKVALRKFEDGAQEYSIGNRTFKRVQMKDLRMRLGELNAICFREKQAELVAQGLGNPRNLAIRF